MVLYKYPSFAAVIYHEITKQINKDIHLKDLHNDIIKFHFKNHPRVRLYILLDFADVQSNAV